MGAARKMTLGNFSLDFFAKRQGLWFMTLVLAVLVVSACGGEKLPRLPAYDPRWSGDCSPNEPVSIPFPLSEERGEAEVYRLDIVKNEYADVVEIARKLGIKSDPVYDANIRHYRAEDEQAELLVADYVGFGYRRKSHAENGPIREALTEAEAEKVAQDFLRDLNLLPRAELATTTRTPQPDGDVVVDFELANIPMPVSPGYPRISVEVGPDGQVWDLDYMWQEPHSVGKYPIVSETEAIERLRVCEAYVTHSGGDLEVTQKRLAYVDLYRRVGGPRLTARLTNASVCAQR